ncbi:MAG: hypothetical protein J6I85_07590 [Clostridia bacterium]|nr:hypothetical protein [Clostridia bacterium]
MNAKFVSLRWIKGEPAHLVQGIKGNKTPKNALKGSNGSFIVAGSPTEIILTVELENGNVCRYDIYRQILLETGRKKMSQKLFDTVESKFEKTTFEYDEKTGDISWNCLL